ncbi:hypothetical protein H8E07_01810 [bacterium]|nr:hypothetical protein [bacterium]
MVILPGASHQTYFDRFGDGRPFPGLPCPDPGCARPMAPHGWYPRYLDAVLVSFRRALCKRCMVSHAVLPDDVVAYRDATLDQLEAAFDAGTPAAGARAANQPGTAGKRRVRRWFRMTDALFVQRLLVLLPPTDGTWLQRARRLFGSAPGVLVRLRLYLWSRRGYLLGPPRLFRHGRPQWPVRRPSTDIGNCPDPASSRRPP